jgi:hypothetical protein
MSYQHHWVVIYDEDWKCFMVDAEHTTLMFDEDRGSLYNKTLGVWEQPEEDSILRAEYLRLEKTLAYQLTRLELDKLTEVV